MRTCIAGDGSDSTAAVLAYLGQNQELRLATVYLIGLPEDPLALWLTDYESPLMWPCWTNEKRNPGGFPKAFDPAVITRGGVTSDVGLDVQQLTVTWSPVNKTYTTSIATASPYQLSSLGYYDNWQFRAWTVFMPTPGDANTFGAAELFGGHIASSTVRRGKIEWTVNSFLDVVNQYVPTNVIELLNTGAAYSGATPPSGFTKIPQFNCVTGSSIDVILGDQTSPVPHSILNTNNCVGGYLVFNTGNGSTLGGIWTPISQNIGAFSGGATSGGGGSGIEYNQFVLTAPLPWPPTPVTVDIHGNPTGDTFYVSGAAPINQADGDYYGFPYVPGATSSF